jgi:drug/metabolite transporter (DMT)-like permease
MLGVGLALAASLCWGVADFFGGIKSRTMPVLALLAASQLVGLATIVAIALIAQKPAPDIHHVLLAMLAAVCGTIGLATFFRAIVVGKMSVVVPIAATAAIIPVVVGIARGERPGPLQLVGLAVGLAGAVLASREPDPDGTGGRVAAGALLAALAAVAIGCFLVVVDAASVQGAVWTSLVARITSTSLLAIAVLVVRPTFSGVPGNLRVLALIGVLDVMANLLYATATNEGLLSLVAVAGSLYPIITVVLARLVLHERVHRIQEVGVAAALGGVVLIAAG